MPATSIKPELPGLRLLGKRLLVSIIPDPTEVGGILMPEAQKHISRIRAEVVQVGPKVPEDILEAGLKAGRIIHARRELGYIKVIVCGKELAIMPVESVLGWETT